MKREMESNFELLMSCEDPSVKSRFVFHCLGLKTASSCLQHWEFLCRVVNVIHGNFLSN